METGELLLRWRRRGRGGCAGTSGRCLGLFTMMMLLGFRGCVDRISSGVARHVRLRVRDRSIGLTLLTVVLGGCSLLNLAVLFGGLREHCTCRQNRCKNECLHSASPSK